MIYLFLTLALNWSASIRPPRQEWAEKTDWEITTSYKNKYLYSKILYERESDSLCWGHNVQLSYKYKFVEASSETNEKTAKGIKYQATQLGFHYGVPVLSNIELSGGLEAYSNDFYSTIKYSPYFKIGFYDIKLHWSMSQRGIEGQIPLINDINVRFSYIHLKEKEDWQLKLSND